MEGQPYNKYRGEVRFPLADVKEAKAVFRFRMTDLEKLVSRYGEQYLTTLEKACRNNNALVVKDFAICGLKGEGGSSAPKVDWDDPPFHLGALYQPINDALTFAVTGLTAEEFQAKVEAELEKRKAEVEKAFPLDRTASPATSSAVQDGQATSSA